METIQQQLRQPAHYLSMKKRHQAANLIDKLEDALHRYGADDVLLTSQITIADQAAQIEALTFAVENRNAIIGVYIEKLGYVAA